MSHWWGLGGAWIPTAMARLTGPPRATGGLTHSLTWITLPSQRRQIGATGERAARPSAACETVCGSRSGPANAAP
jgi:hypothetical protein